MNTILGTFFHLLGTGILIALSLNALQSLVLSILFLRVRHKNPPQPPATEVWPQVTVQLPVYNERFVVTRLIDAACRLDYPADKLHIQVLDDSTDDTTLIARQRAAHHRHKGLDIQVIHRENRSGFKAGALGNALPSAKGEFIAIFDADFIPPPDFLRRQVPYLVDDPHLGLVQTRWAHLNAGQNWTTRAQALSIDGHFVIIQTARSRSGLLFNFNGTAGIWRREAIEGSGGWQIDNLAEDLDLSYRAQLQGWRMLFRPEELVFGEIPTHLAAYKLQQARWAQGGIQVLRKLAGPIWRSQFSLLTRLACYFHLGSYLTHPLLLIFLLVCIPGIILLKIPLPSLQILTLLAGAGPPLLIILSQWGAYDDWLRRVRYFPILIVMSIGLALNNSIAVFRAFRQNDGDFKRTPKGLPEDMPMDLGSNYRLPFDWTVGGELILAVYAGAVIFLARGEYQALIPLLTLSAISFGYVGILGLWQSIQDKASGKIQHPIPVFDKDN